jgi:hypothetical protein
VKKIRQSGFFQSEDLPLFSGTPIKAHMDPFSPPVGGSSQPTFPVRCPACLDIGTVDGRFCGCEAGHKANLDHLRATVVQQICSLSSGTLATLTGLKTYTEVDALRMAWIAWISQSGQSFANWMDAWSHYQAEGMDHAA